MQARDCNSRELLSVALRGIASLSSGKEILPLNRVSGVKTFYVSSARAISHAPHA